MPNSVEPVTSRVSPAVAGGLAATIAANLDPRRVLVVGPGREEVVDVLRARLDKAAVVASQDPSLEAWITWPDVIVGVLELSSCRNPRRAIERLAAAGSHAHYAFVECAELPLIPLLEDTFTTVEWFIQEAGELANLVYLGAHARLVGAGANRPAHHATGSIATSPDHGAFTAPSIAW